MSGEEARRRARGREFRPPAQDLASIPPLYGTEAVPLSDKVIHLRYFVKDCCWWVEYDPAEERAWCYACLDDLQTAEWGMYCGDRRSSC